MEERVGPLTFFSNFDSGNLAKVERAKQDEDNSEEDTNAPFFAIPDYEYNVWTWPDAVGTEFENLNRTWFHFGVKGGSPGRLLKINIMNLNRQGKLFSQGMSPFVKVVPGRDKWERIRERPTYETVEGQFHLSFTYRFPEQRNSVHYFAFCYPYSYGELQTHLQTLDKIYVSCKQMSPETPSSSIYYHRELLSRSLDNLRLDLLTVTSCKGMMKEREARLEKLFPEDDSPRPHKFQEKKVYFLSARVHPGETPASYVFNGFLDFILRPDDPRAKALRDQYVFKLIPMLNPDGVKRGHYRTDSRGINLNRVYLDPDPVLHPTIFAAKSVVMYHHGNYTESENKDGVNCTCGRSRNVEIYDTGLSAEDTEGVIDVEEKLPLDETENVEKAKEFADDCMTIVSAESLDLENSKNDIKDSEVDSNFTGIMKILYKEDSILGSANPIDYTLKDNKPQDTQIVEKEPIEIWTECSNINPEINNNRDLCLCSAADFINKCHLEYYVDLHGHASKRGCFVYANYLENENDYVKSILYPKLMSINSANFDFTGCNFTEKNMYSKDKRDGMSKEGSGRVAVFKATSIVHSYTLECNYNSGRMLNPVPPATCDSGRATPPPPPGFPPKFTTEIYEEVGRALAVAVLDMNNSNPWSRLPISEFSSVEGVKSWVRRFVKSVKNAPSVPKKLSRVITKTSSIVAGATGSRQKICSTLKSTSSSSDLLGESLSAAAQKVTERMAYNINASKKLLDDTKSPKKTQSFPTPRRLSQTLSGQPIKKFSPVWNGNSYLNSQASSFFRTQPHKSTSRVSLELPKTGPALRIPKPNPLLASNIKAISCPADLRVGHSNQVEVRNQFIGPQRKKVTTKRPGGGSASDEEKKRRSTFSKKRNGRRKGKPDDLVNGKSRSGEVDPISKVSTIKKGTGTGRKGSEGTLLQRPNSRNKKMMHSKVNSCEVVDITKLPQSHCHTLAYWVDA